MGQRVAIILKKNYKDKSIINVIHHQWGIGKVIGSLFLQELLESIYPLDRRLENNWEVLPIDKYFTFEPLSSRNNNYIYNQEVELNDEQYDIWNEEVRIKLGNMTDNNNGLMLVEVTQKYNTDGKAENYGDCLDVKVGFALGYEETSEWNDKLIDKFTYEDEFRRLVSIQEYVNRTFERGIEEGHNKLFIDSFNNLCNLFGVKQIYDELGESKRNTYEKHIHNLIDQLYEENGNQKVSLTLQMTM